MKKTLIITMIAVSFETFAAPSVFDIMNLSKEQHEAIEQVRENKKIENNEKKQRSENEQIEINEKLARQEYNESTQMQDAPIDPVKLAQLNSPTEQQYAAIDYSQFAVNVQEINPNDEKEVQKIINSRVNLPAVSQQQVINVQQYNQRVMMSEFEKIQQKSELTNAFPSIKNENK